MNFLKSALFSFLLMSVSVFIITLATGCAPDDAWDIATDFEATAVPTGQSNSYNVQLRWSEGQNNQSLRLVRHMNGPAARGNPEAFEIAPGKSSFTDVTTVAGASYTYSLIASDDLQETLGSASIVVPHDVTISESGPLHSIETTGKVYIAEGVELTTGGSPVTIKASELIAPKATIRVFPEGKKAEPGAVAANAGEIRIICQRASGNIHIIADGELGADGTAGAPGKPGTNGKDGKDAKIDVNPDLLPELDARQLEYYRLLLEKRAFSADILRLTFVHNAKPVYRCITAAESGERGGDGATGQTGGNGGRGGDSAKVLTEIEEQSPLIVTISSEPGYGGDPGPGGKGGPPGNEGLAGKQDWLGLSPISYPGVRGQKGADGRPGRPGNSGYRNPVCFRMGGKTIQGDIAPFRLADKP